MHSEDKLMAVFVLAVAFCIVSLIAGLTLQYTVITCKALDNGYEQVVLPGSSVAKWHKAD